MPGEWRQEPFSSAVLINPPVRLKRGCEYPFVSMDAIGPGSRWVYASRQRAYEGGGSRFQDGDTLLARITPCLENGKIARFKASGYISVAHGSTELIVIRGRAGVTDTGFAYYLTQSPLVRGYAISQMTGTSGRQRVPIEAFEHLLVPIPPLPEQRAIAHILGTLDDKIELNRRMNETLEAMAQAMFKSWFIDFDPVRAKAEGRDTGLPPDVAALFPDSFEDSELGQIPRRWRVGKLGDVAVSPRRTVRPADLRPETPYIGLEHMPRRSIALTEWGRAQGVESGKFGFEKGEILFGKLRPYFHKIGVAPLDGVCSTDIVVLAPRSKGWSGFVLEHASSTPFVEYTNSGSTGTKMPRTSWGDMARYPVALPTEEIAKEFSNRVCPLIDKIVLAVHESHALACLRDTLLPKLLSGEVSTRDVQEAIAVVDGQGGIDRA